MIRPSPPFSACSTSLRSRHTGGNKNSPTFSQKWGSFSDFLGAFWRNTATSSVALPFPHRWVHAFGTTEGFPDPHDLYFQAAHRISTPVIFILFEAIKPSPTQGAKHRRTTSPHSVLFTERASPSTSFAALQGSSLSFSTPTSIYASEKMGKTWPARAHFWRLLFQH